MTFSHPWLLLLLVIPCLLVAFVWCRQGRRLVLPLDHSPRPPSRGFGWIINIAESLPALLLAVAVVILCGPRQLSDPKNKRVMTNIEFCVDVSGSMTAGFGSGSRYDASMAAINEFLDFRDGDAFGLTFFGNTFMHWVPLTTDTSAFRCAPPFMKPSVVPSWFRGTEIGKALLACKRVLSEREEGDRMIILVSDGSSSDLGNGNDEEIARTLQDHSIVVYAIHIAETNIPDPIVNITSFTGGEVFNPGDPAALKTVFERIDAMQQTRIEKTTAESMDYFLPFAIAGLALLGLLGMTLFGLRYTPW